MYDLTPLSSDACQSDTSAVCAYWHTKCRAMAGATLTPEQLRFVGFDERPRSRDGWHDASSNLGLIYFHDDREELSSEDSAALHALMAIQSVDLNRERLGFLA